MLRNANINKRPTLESDLTTNNSLWKGNLKILTFSTENGKIGTTLNQKSKEMDTDISKTLMRDVKADIEKQRSHVQVLEVYYYC